MSDEATAPATYNLGDVPDLTGITKDESEPWEDGWYQATALSERSFTSRDTGVTTTFTSGDEPAQGSGRNISIQAQVKRKNGDTLHTRVIVNYLPEFLTTEVIGAVTQHKEAQKKAKKDGLPVPEWGQLFRSFATLQRFGILQRIAGVRQFAKNGNGGLDISPIFGKTFFVRLAPDKKKPQYKSVADFDDVGPKKSPIL